MSTKTIQPETVSAAAIPVAPVHPGQHIRDLVLAPKKLSVLAAAKLVGVGRPALSNFLNGNAMATPDMALRIEVAFGVSSQSLLDMQAAYDAAKSRAKGVPANATPYVVPFLGIKATDIEAWITRDISARTRLSVFLRTLVNSTGSGIKKINFPGNDDAERSGWDGYAETAQATPWVPEGISGWEFGVNKDNIKGKADGDFAKSVKAFPDKAERSQVTFVFVTPRHWPGKNDWIKANKAKNQWKDVCAYDSSDLEQWLEQSIAAQVWFANETLRPLSGVRSLDRAWTDWANVASPPLVGDFFAPAIESAKRTMLSHFSRQPNEPTMVAADSIEEALAFLAQIFGPAGGEELNNFRDRVVVFDEPGILPRLAQGTKGFIAVATNRDVEREFGPYVRSMHTIVIYPRNAANVSPHVILEPLNHDAFHSSLEKMGYGRDDISRYSNESGRSLTVLRRRLANLPAVKTPEWAANHETAIGLIPFMFIGAWNSANTADQTVLALLAEVNSYEKLERECQRLTSLNDAPLWAVGTYRGVISKIDLLFAIANSITRSDLERYCEMAKMVLGEDDPALDLPESERWIASFHGKSREFSAALRQGISETLVLLAVHGNNLFRAKLGFDCEAAIARIVRELLTPLKTRILEANDRDLAAYAEAAPDEFLSILEEDLNSDHPESYGLMKPIDPGIFGGGSSARTGLLWALEGLAWSPETLPRVALILAQLAGIEIKDNLVNKPIHSLGSIFRAWMPQTAANHETRLGAVRGLVAKFPKVAWEICIEQLPTSHRTGDYTHKPRWRNDANGFGQPFETWGPINAFIREMVDLVLGWNDGYTREMLCDLIQHLHSLSDEHQGQVWGLVKSWAGAGASDADKAFVREKIRVTVMSRQGARRSKDRDFAKLSAAAKIAYQVLEPVDILHRCEWLFRAHWVEESADEIDDESIDFREREARIAALRVEALREIFQARGAIGIFELAEIGNAAYPIGSLMGQELLSEQDFPGFLIAALQFSPNSQSAARRNLIAGALRAVHDEKRRVAILKKTKKELSSSNFTDLLLLAPFRRSTWLLIDKLNNQCRETYWGGIAPDWIPDTDDENIEAVERLLNARRPRAAFASVRYKFEAIGPELLFRLMTAVAKEGTEPTGQYQLEQYYVEQAFAFMDKSPVLTLEQKAGLEFAYIGILSQPWNRNERYGVPNLEKYVEAHPELFVQSVAWTYRRGEGEDPPEWAVAPDQAKQLAERGYKLLEGIGRMPGHDDLGVLQADRLATWIKTVRDACAQLGRLDIADVCIGKLLSGAPSGEDGVWPCEPVRRVIEDVHSKEMMQGAHTGIYNSRGATWRGEGGAQERGLAEKYRSWANALQYSHPFVASQLLMVMVKTYEDEANREDIEAGIRKRLR